MINRISRSARALLPALLVLTLLFAAQPAPARAANATPSQFRDAMRMLWEDHITWTRLYIVSVAADLPDKDAAAQRLLQNQTDIGNAIKPYYGDAAGDKLTALLKDHILGAATLLGAAKAGNSAQVDAASKAWYANGDEIAVFLAAANPRFGTAESLKAGMKMHLDLTLEEATARLQGKYAADIAAYDKVHEHILGLADALSSGIVAQFPDRFDASRPADPALHAAMRRLWEDHVQWTRFYIVSVAGNLPDKDPTAQRLLQNQTDIGNAIKAYYGDAAGDKLAALLKDHILGAADLLAAAKAGDKAKTDAASAKWSANANEIAAFLSGANPAAWPLGAMRDGMKMHLDLTLAEATARLQGKTADDIQAYDKVHTHILGLADTLSGGIIAQFPGKFAPATLPKTGADVHAAHSGDDTSGLLALLLGLGGVGLAAANFWLARKPRS